MSHNETVRSQAPVPSQRCLDMIGHEITLERDGKPPVRGTITDAERVISVITQGDGSLWTAVRFRIKPADGRRAFWTTSFPDEQYATSPPT